MVGGYKILDLKGTNFTDGTGKTINGIYDAIESAGSKPLLLGNYSIGGVDKISTYLSLALDGATFTGTVNGYTLTISDADLVTFTS